MKTTTTKKVAVVWVVALLAALLMPSTPPAQAADSHVGKTVIFPPIGERVSPEREVAGMAPGAAEDTLKACMARIPELASVGQHLLAEQNCAGEEKTRKAIRSAPKF